MVNVIQRSGSDGFHLSLSSMEWKKKFHRKAVCAAQRMPVRLFNSIFFFLLCYSPHNDDAKIEIEEASIMFRIMIHQPASSFFDDDDSDEVIVEVDELVQMYQDIIKVYAQRTGAPLWVIAMDIERDVFLSAEEAQKHGLVDLVGMDDFWGFILN